MPKSLSAADLARLDTLLGSDGYRRGEVFLLPRPAKRTRRQRERVDLGGYQVRPSKTGLQPGIYLRAYNVRLATFSPNSDQLQQALARVFDLAHKRGQQQAKIDRGSRDG